VLFIIIITTLVDIVLHVIGVFPPMDQRSTRLALLATSYRIIIGVGGAWLTARLAPERPMKHALISASWALSWGSWALWRPGTSASGPGGTRSRSSCWRSAMLGRR